MKSFKHIKWIVGGGLSLWLLTNAHAEGINSRIQRLIQQSCGYRNRDRFKRDVLFHLGNLDLYPLTNQ